jgi:hypothetical protein
MIDSALRPMSTSELLDRTFHLYRNNFFLFAGIAALAPALVLATELLAIAIGIPSDYQSYKAEAVHPIGTALFSLLKSFILLLIYLVAGQLSYGATVYGVSRVHMGSRTTIPESYKSIRPFWGSLVGVSLLIGLRMAGIGIVLGIVVVFGITGLIGLPFVIWWGIYVYARCCLGGAACVLEGASAAASIERSRFLTLGSTWRIFLILLLTGVLSLALGYALGLPAEILKRTHPGADLMVTVTRQLGEFLAHTLTAPIGAISLVLVYYDQRIRKEAFDLEIMMQAMDQREATVTSASV